MKAFSIIPWATDEATSYRALTQPPPPLPSLRLRAIDELKPAISLVTQPSSAGAIISGGKGPVSEGETSLTLRTLDFNRISFSTKGVAVVENHLSRFGVHKHNEEMLDRLHRIVAGEIEATNYDKKFYTHELREFVRFRKAGYAQGEVSWELYSKEHGATLKEYGLYKKGYEYELYHPDAAKLFDE